MKHKILTLIVVIALLISTEVSTYALEIHQESAAETTGTTDLVLDETTLNLCNSQITEYEDAADSLANALKDAEPSDYSKIIRGETSNLEITEQIGEIAGDYTEKTNEIPCVEVECDNLLQVYKLDYNTTLEVTPLYVAVEEFTINQVQETNSIDSFVSKVVDFFIDEAYAGTTVKSVGGRSTKTFYATGYGYKMLTMSVGMYFNYDGTKAWYKSDFDAYWTKYLGGALIQVQDWHEIKETSGTSYQGWCSGVFGEGIVIDGNLISLSSKYLIAKVSCNKNGVITRT